MQLTVCGWRVTGSEVWWRVCNTCDLRRTLLNSFHILLLPEQVVTQLSAATLSKDGRRLLTIIRDSTLRISLDQRPSRYISIYLIIRRHILASFVISKDITSYFNLLSKKWLKREFKVITSGIKGHHECCFSIPQEKPLYICFILYHTHFRRQFRQHFEK